MNVVDCWTGREARLLRKALRLSVRRFAEYLGVGVRTVNKWEAKQADITPLPQLQEVLDTALSRASDEAKARFSVMLGEPARPDPDPRTAISPGEAVLVPVVLDDQLVLLPLGLPIPVTAGADPVTVQDTEADADDVGEVDWVLRRDFTGASAVAAISAVLGARHTGPRAADRVARISSGRTGPGEAGGAQGRDG